MWYFTEEMILLALFDADVPPEEKDDIAAAMRQCNISNLEIKSREKKMVNQFFYIVKLDI